MVKNSANTFTDIRSMLCDSACPSIYIPALDSELTALEISANFFRNIFNQVKQQTGKGLVVRDCIVSVATEIDRESSDRIAEAAKKGGLRVLGFCRDHAAALVSHDLDDGSSSSARALTAAVVDVGWCETRIAVYNICDGSFFLLVDASVKEMSMRAAVDRLTDFCAKDFQRRHKASCADSKRAMTRLAAECESAIKILSSSQETVIVVDSLYEGIDYSAKISRSRFDDLCAASVTSLRAQLRDVLSGSGISAADVSHVIMTGGGGSLSSVQTTVRSVLSSAQVLRSRNDPSEAACVGAAMHGASLIANVSAV
jgi:heat shock protein 1/8